MTGNWRDRTDTVFECQKQPASGSRGMVVSNHPLASAAGAEMLAAGGNAIDAAIATLFTLTVVEPMMVGIIGGGMAHIRLADGSHRFIDGQSTVPLAVRPDTYRSKPGSAHDVFDTVGDENLNGPKAVAVPGSLKAWCETLRRFGTMPLADVMQPAIKHASRGYAATPYLHECISDGAAEMLKDKAISAIYLPDGTPLKAGERVVQSEYAETLSLYCAAWRRRALYGSARRRPRRLHEGQWRLHHAPGPDILQDRRARADPGRLSRLADSRAAAARRLRRAHRADAEYSGGLRHRGARLRHRARPSIISPRCLKIAFADRAAASGDPDFVGVPVERLTSKDYARERRGAIDPKRAQKWSAGVAQLEGAHTTHMTAADAFGNVVATTQTINNLFGAKILIPGLGTVPNNYMNLYDPRPGHALSLAPGKRVTTSMSPMMALRDGKLVYALGLPGGKKIFPSAMQALINLIDHGMSLQEAVEAPRVWTEGNALEVEADVPDSVRAGAGIDGA